MRIETAEDGSSILKEVYLGVMFQSYAGEEFGICMRDSGFEFHYAGAWYEAKNGIVNVLGYDCDNN